MVRKRMDKTSLSSGELLRKQPPILGTETEESWKHQAS